MKEWVRENTKWGTETKEATNNELREGLKRKITKERTR
jgi:hypothetical protein